MSLFLLWPVDQLSDIPLHVRLSQDTKATQNVIINVRDSIFRGYLKDAALV